MKLLLLMVVAIAGIIACASELPPPCDSGTAAAMAATCSARVQVECVDKGVPPDQCAALEECDKAADDRQTKCGGGK